MWRHLAAHPLDPFGYDVNWYGVLEPVHQVTCNPPLASYYMALVGTVCGWNEVTLHVAFLLPAMLAPDADPPGGASAGSVATGDAVAIGNRSTTVISQQATAAAAGDGSVVIEQRAVVANVGAAVANTGSNVVAAHREAGPDQVLGEGRAQQPHPDERDGGAHGRLRPGAAPLCSRTLIGRRSRRRGRAATG